MAWGEVGSDENFELMDADWRNNIRDRFLSSGLRGMDSQEAFRFPLSRGMSHGEENTDNDVYQACEKSIAWWSMF